MIGFDTPSRASDAGPDTSNEVETRDASDWIFEARWQARIADTVERDDPKVQRKLRLEAIDLAIDALRCAKELVEVGR